VLSYGYNNIPKFGPYDGQHPVRLHDGRIRDLLDKVQACRKADAEKHAQELKGIAAKAAKAQEEKEAQRIKDNEEAQRIKDSEEAKVQQDAKVKDKKEKKVLGLCLRKKMHLVAKVFRDRK